MSSPKQVNLLIQQISKNQTFIAEVRRLVQDCKSDGVQPTELPTFAFEKAAKYPWSICENDLPVEGQKMIDQMTGMIVDLIDHNLHEILNRQFINVTNELLVIREEMTNFRGQFEEQYRKMQEEFSQQLQAMRKKMVVQQNTNLQRKQFVRTRASGVIASSQASIVSSYAQKGELRAEMVAMKKEIQQLKKSMGGQLIVHTLSDKMVYIEEKMQSQMQQLKIKIQSTRQRSQKGLIQVSLKVNEATNREIMSNQIKRAVKGHFKVYLQQINGLKSKLAQLEENLEKADKGLQNYIGNQLKTVWVMISNLKRKVQQISEQINMGNQSFILQ